MYQVKLRSLQAGTAHFFGATMAADHLKEIACELAGLPAASDDESLGVIVLVDFDRVVSATSSYLKGLLFPFLRENDPQLAGPASQLNVFPVLAGLSPEVREEIVELTQLSGRVLLEATDVRAAEVANAQLHGSLEPALRETLALLQQLGRATAPQLHAAAKSSIKVTAWNNRLADLNLRRLARRERDGRSWIYRPAATEIQYG